MENHTYCICNGEDSGKHSSDLKQLNIQWFVGLNTYNKNIGRIQTSMMNELFVFYLKQGAGGGLSHMV